MDGYIMFDEVVTQKNIIDLINKLPKDKDISIFDLKEKCIKDLENIFI